MLERIVQSFIDLVSMAKWLIDENQQPSATQYLGRLFPSIRGWGRRGESSEGWYWWIICFSNWYIQIILVSQHSLPQNGQLKKYGDQKQHQRNHESLCHIKQPQEKLQVNLLFFPVQNPVISDLLLSSYHFSIWSSTTVVWSFPNKKWVILSHFSLVQNKYKDFELMLLRQICQRNHVLNYASGWSGH